MLSDPHLKDREFFQEVNDPVAGKRAYEGMLFKLSDTPGRIHRGAPRLGQDTDYVLTELLDMSDAEIEQLRAEQVLY